MAKRITTLRALAIGCGVAVALGTGSAALAQTASGFVDAVKSGALILDARARYEGVDQDGLGKRADAVTLRTRLGWETGEWNNLKALVEFEDVRAIGGERFNSTLNGRTAYPVVADPDVTELNRAQIAWTPNRSFTATIGRQIVAIGDQRFIGSSAWRQDQQTFDAVRADVTRGPFSASYIYVDRVNRVFAEAQDWDSDSHVLSAAYVVAKPLKVEGFLYALDFRQSPANSSRTYGLRATGVLDTAPVAFPMPLPTPISVTTEGTPAISTSTTGPPNCRGRGTSSPSKAATRCLAATACADFRRPWRRCTPSRAGPMCS